MFPPQVDPSGDPESWTREDMRRWLTAASSPRRTVTRHNSDRPTQRNLHPQDGDTREQLLERVRANLRIPRP